MSTINVGDVVWLRSGGPAMTVVKIGGERGADSVMCTWFPLSNGDYLHPDTAYFLIHCLRTTNPLIGFRDDDDDDGDSASEDSITNVDTAVARPSYYIDVGSMSPEQATRYLSELRTELSRP